MMENNELNVRDTVLYISKKIDRCYVHTKTKEKLRLTDGIKHEVTVTKVSPEEMEKLWVK